MGKGVAENDSPLMPELEEANREMRELEKASTETLEKKRSWFGGIFMLEVKVGGGYSVAETLIGKGAV